MHPGTRLRNGYLTAKEITQNHPEDFFGPKGSGLGMFVAKKQDPTSEAQSGALYALQNLISQRVPPGFRIARNHPET